MTESPTSVSKQQPARPWPPTEREKNLYGKYWPWSQYKKIPNSDPPERSPKGSVCAVCMNVYRDLGASTGSYWMGLHLQLG